MGCNCKSKERKPITNLTDSTPTYTWGEVSDAMQVINTKIHYNYEEQEMLYDLHNRMYPKNKQYNFNCSECFKLVVKNIRSYYETNKEDNR